LISNFNYARYLGEALDSALCQSVPFDQIVVVDDGSSDSSREILEARYARDPRVTIIAKQNGGQLSCFNAGFAHASGDIVFFLDADDVYEPTYVERALDVFRREPAIEFLACGRRWFGVRDGVKLQFALDRDLGYSAVVTAHLHEWIGAPTSCLSMRRHVLEQILPLPNEHQWRTRADDCLVFGASLAGARKYYLAQPLVRYRVHEGNHFCGRAQDRFAVYRRRLAVNRLFEHLARKLCYDVDRLGEIAHREFATVSRPTFRQLRKYLHIGMRSRASLPRRLTCALEMAGYYLRTRLSPRGSLQSGVPVETATDRAGALRVFSPGDVAPLAGPAASEMQRRAA
jgi:glycosyltransferase involved in cell wall biosynthesis